jgi:cyclin-dependent kinase 12/13
MPSYDGNAGLYERKEPRKKSSHKSDMEKSDKRKKDKKLKKKRKSRENHDDRNVVASVKPLVEYSDVSSEELSSPEAGEIQSEESVGGHSDYKSRLNHHDRYPFHRISTDSRESLPKSPYSRSPSLDSRRHWETLELIKRHKLSISPESYRSHSRTKEKKSKKSSKKHSPSRKKRKRSKKSKSKDRNKSPLIDIEYQRRELGPRLYSEDFDKSLAYSSFYEPEDLPPPEPSSPLESSNKNGSPGLMPISPPNSNSEAGITTPISKNVDSPRTPTSSGNNQNNCKTSEAIEEVDTPVPNKSSPREARPRSRSLVEILSDKEEGHIMSPQLKHKDSSPDLKKYPKKRSPSRHEVERRTHSHKKHLSHSPSPHKSRRRTPSAEREERIR